MKSRDQKPLVLGRPGNGWLSSPQEVPSHLTAGDGPITTVPVSLPWGQLPSLVLTKLSLEVLQEEYEE